MRRMLSVLAALLALAGTWCAPARAEATWTANWAGDWATTWRDGGAYLHLDQHGDAVTGAYPLYGGRIEATAHGSLLKGRWFEGAQTGGFVFVMGRDGDSFSGRYDSGEWWTGARAAAPQDGGAFDLTTPRGAFGHFVVAANLGRGGRTEAWGEALQGVDFGAAAASLSRSEQLQQVRDLFAVIDLTTFRVWSVPDHADGDTVPVRLDQAGTDASITLTMDRAADGDWRIRMPTPAALDADRRALLAGRGGKPPAADAYRRLRNPRDTMRSFLEGMADWDGGGRALALSTMDLSGIPEVLRRGQGAMDAQYLRRVLDKIGLVGLQAIPDNAADRTPYVHFSHPAGRVVIAPSGPEADAPWKFTAETVADADDLYRALDGLPPPLATPPGLIPPAPFFTVRDFVRARAPFLLGAVGAVEYWQMIFVLLVVLAAACIGTAVATVVGRLPDRFAGCGVARSRLFTWSVGVTVGVIVMAPFAVVGGMPEEVRRWAYPTMGITLTLASSLAAWHLLEIAGAWLQGLSDRTAAATDDILFTLLVATARLGVVVACFLRIAYYLSIPTNGILAGLGIGGLAFAFASRETLSNVFGAGILVADRPFRRGDWITSGEIEGSVEHVGVRSTRVRTAQDSIVVVPNGKLSDSTINNLGTRRYRLVKSLLTVTAGGTPERLDAFAAAVRERVAGDDAFVAGRTDVGVACMNEVGIQVEVIAYLNVNSTSAERAARHALLVDVLELAETCGLTLGAGTTRGAAVAAGAM
jgi:small-conductance mechanosensitive channel